MKVQFTILGEAASKANSRKIATIAGKTRSIKSDKALGFEAMALRQIPPRARVRFSVPVRVTMRMFYASERPDLDESLVLDVLQDRYITRFTKRADGTKDKSRVLLQAGVYQNDRLVREKHVYHAIDKQNPRVEIEIEPIAQQQNVVDEVPGLI